MEHNQKSLLFPQRNFNHEPTHYLVQPKIFLRTSRMRVVATNASLANGAVCINGLEVGLLADLPRTGGRMFGMFPYSPKALLFLLAVRAITRIDRP